MLILCLTFVGGQSSFTQDWSQVHPLGDIPLDPAVYERYLKIWPEQMLEALPGAYDARDDGIVTSAKNQGNCGSCWAFASAGAMESHLLKAYQYGPADLSEQQQVSCNTAMLGCAGGSATALRYWEGKGPLEESCFPYTGNDSTPCAEDQCIQLAYRVTGYYTVFPATTQFKDSLYVDGPSYWRFNVYSDFDTYWAYGNPGEVYTSRSGASYRGGHAVLLIGWDDTKGAFLCKNSWGGGGPNNDGTFWIAYTGHYNNLGFGMSNFSLTSVGCTGDGECDDGLYCNGTETCDGGLCQNGIPPVCPDDGVFCNGSEVCDEFNDTCGSTGNPCGPGTVCNEDTTSCDLLNCGNEVCEVGENCNNCPDDCISGTGGGTCEACFKGVCDGVCHPVKEGPECSDCAPSYCCGDGICQGPEDGDNCAIDCGAAPYCGDGACDPGEDPCSCTADCSQWAGPEANHCSDGVDNDCDGSTDCDDSDCASDPTCLCTPKGGSCTFDTDCCSNKCRASKCR